MALVWVIGSGGLLGKALHSEISKSTEILFDPAIKFYWSNPKIVSEQLENAVNQFSLLATKKICWKIYWAAGVGNMHSAEETLLDEQFILEKLISSLLSNANLNLRAGTFIFSSSAGAIYAGAKEGVVTELTDPAPINAYGKAKLLQEYLINKLNKDGHGATVVACRITTLYGFSSMGGKQQGLIGEMIRKILSNQVAHIYVPLQTMRDYISASNAAKQMIDVAELKTNENLGTYVKIIASGTSVSIAQILAILRRICKRNLRIVTQADIKIMQYQRVVQFKSVININNEKQHQNNLIEGILDLLNAIQKDIFKNGNSA
jgi:UDP-glucose 4-epimerase